MSENKVDRYEHDKTLLCLNHQNRRMFFVVLAVCITFSLIIIAYTIREKNWLDTISRICTPAVTEVSDGTQQSGDP